MNISSKKNATGNEGVMAQAEQERLHINGRKIPGNGISPTLYGVNSSTDNLMSRDVKQLSPDQNGVTFSGSQNSGFSLFGRSSEPGNKLNTHAVSMIYEQN